MSWMTGFAKTKRCSTCQQFKSRSEFYARSKGMPNSLDSRCKECLAQRNQEQAWDKARRQVRAGA